MDLETLKSLNSNYESACNNILQAFSKEYDVQVTPNDWVGDECGTIVCVNEEFFINMEDIRFMLNKGISWNDFLRWWDYCQDCGYLGLKSMNLRAWVNGAPHHSEEEIERLKSLRKEFDDTVNKLNGGY